VARWEIGLDSMYHTLSDIKDLPIREAVRLASMPMPSALSLAFSTMAASRSAADTLALFLGLLMALLFAFASFCRW